MATAFIQTPIFSDSFVLTSEARTIAVQTDEDRLSVSLACDGVVFFAVELSAYNGIVELYDPGSLIESYFIRNEMICEPVTITFGSASANVLFLCCENVMPGSFNPSDILLLSSQVRRVHEGSRFTVAALPAGPSVPFVFKAVGHNERGEIASVRFSEARDIINTPYTTFSVNQIISKATGNNTEGAIVENPISDVMYFSVENGPRQLMCYVMPAAAYLTFRFRNNFNVPELIDIEGSMNTKSEISRQSARCCGDMVQYDRRVDRTYEMTTGPLAADEVESVIQLVSSHTIQLYADDTFHDIIIEDHTCEDSSDDESITQIKFTWRFKGVRPVNFNSSIFGVSPSHRGIFSDEYSPEYE